MRSRLVSCIASCIALVCFASAAVFLFSGSTAHAQFAGATPTTTVHDAAPLKPPPGARVAIVEFEDMECPECGRSNPILKAAAAQYHIPWIRHDFPLPFHAWSFQAAVYARWFDTKSKKLGDDFRDAVFANQNSIDAAAQSNPENSSGPTAEATAAIRDFAGKFASQHGIALPFVIDPQKKLAGLVQADLDLGNRVGIQHTPTIWVVTNKRSGTPYIEVTDLNRLYSIIDSALAETRSEAGPHHGAAGD